MRRWSLAFSGLLGLGWIVPAGPFPAILGLTHPPKAMALAPGSRSGPYEVTALIGAGGRGEVYCARDTKLNRDVAIKTLPDLLADKQ